MSTQSHSVVIVDQNLSFGWRLWSSLVKQGVNAHIFNGFAPALMLMRQKKVDAVVLEYSSDAHAVALRDAAKELKVPIVFIGGPLNEEVKRSSADGNLGASAH